MQQSCGRRAAKVERFPLNPVSNPVGGVPNNILCLASPVYSGLLTRMKNMLKVAVLSLSLASLMAVSAHAQSRFATVNLQKLFNNYWMTKQSQASLQARAGELDKTRKELVDGWQKAREEYNKLLMDANDQAVSAEEREKRKTAAQEKLKFVQETASRIDGFDTQAKTILDETKSRLTETIFTKIRDAVSAKARKTGYQVVLDTSTPIVVFSSGENDITDVVLSELNATAPVEIPAKPDDKQPATTPAK
jgi:Skp family chaperone for outer membrane proteins